MGTYALRRCVTAATVILVLLALLSVLVHLLPGDPVRLMLGPSASAELSGRVRHEMDLDSPVYLQVWHFIAGAASGDLGRDFLTHVPVTQLIGQALPHTLVLAFAALLLAVAIAIPLGTISASRAGSWSDRILGSLSVGVISIPSYVLALLLLLVVAVWLGWLPAIGSGSFSDPLDYLSHLILPAVSLALIWAGYVARVVRASMLEVLQANYVRSATAFGIRRWRVLYQLALRNSVVPVVALLGVALGEMIGSAIFVEVIFTRNGLGTMLYNAVADRDYPVVRGGVVVIAVAFVVANLLADLANRALDPRTREVAA